MLPALRKFFACLAGMGKADLPKESPIVVASTLMKKMPPAAWHTPTARFLAERIQGKDEAEALDLFMKRVSGAVSD